MTTGQEPAFPFIFQDLDGAVTTNDGITVRDLFALGALNGMVRKTTMADVNLTVARAYEYADAMIKERK